MPSTPSREVFISVDTETSGPIPGDYSLLSIGACVVGDPSRVFYIELKPLNENFTEEALRVCELDLFKLKAEGAEPKAALTQFGEWVTRNAPDAHAIFVGFNAPFDWSFVNYYFVKFVGKNPFGHSALDIKSYYMGAYHTAFSATSMKRLPPEIHAPDHPLAHNALDDAKQQSEIFSKLLNAPR